MGSLGLRLKAERKRRGLTLQGVEKLTGINHKTLSGYENNHSEPDVETLSKLANVYGVSTDYLVTGESDEFIPSSRDIRDLRKVLEQNDLMFDGVPLDEDDRERIAQVLEALFWEAKKMNKHKK